MYEKGEYIYAFFREVPVEVKPNVSEHLLEESFIVM